jgi:hypothetical protein
LLISRGHRWRTEASLGVHSGNSCRRHRGDQRVVRTRRPMHSTTTPTTCSRTGQTEAQRREDRKSRFYR